jgi:DNA-binding response OmpR family regulator
MPEHHVLVVDDDPDLRIVLEGVYRHAGFGVTTVPDGRSALRALFDGKVDLVVLDIGLPGLDGFEVLNRIRDVSTVPVLLLTARTREDDKVAGLLGGADDYLTKPFSNRELIARSVALLRRTSASAATADVVDDGLVRLDHDRREAWVEGRPVALTPIEWSLLNAFVRRPGLVLTPAQLLEIAWHDPVGIGPERVKFAVLRLRKRLGWSDPATSPIESVRGVGYRYRPRPSTAAT